MIRLPRAADRLRRRVEPLRNVDGFRYQIDVNSVTFYRECDAITSMYAITTYLGREHISHSRILLAATLRLRRTHVSALQSSRSPRST
jgi:hypothetical protein